jgi:integrase
MGDLPDPAVPADPVHGEVLPPPARPWPGASAARALVGRLVRGGDISPALLTLVDGPLADAVSKAADYAGKSIAPGTVATYKGDWADFCQWARQNGVDPTALPVHPVVVAAWLATLAPAIGRSALRRRVAAIAWHHRRTGHSWQAGHAAIRQTLTGIGREHHRPVRPAAALISTDVKQLIAVCPRDLAGMRDRALFLIGLAGAFRRSELVGIDVAHLRFETESVTVRIPRSKTDQAGDGADVALPRMRGEETCPVGALEAWLRRAKIRRGPVFRRITAAGTIEGRLTGDGVYKILKARAAAAKLTVPDTERLSPHGLRAGMITEATLNGALDEQIMPHSRHKDSSTMRGYRRRARIVVDNPARLLDL